MPGCQASPSATPIPEPPTIDLEIVTLPPTPEVVIKVATLPATPTPVTPPQVTLEIVTLVPTPQPPADATFSYLHRLASGDRPRLLNSYATTADFDDIREMGQPRKKLG